MAQPITWRNIDAPDFRTALAGMGQAQQSIQGALAPLQDVLRQRELINEANWQNQKANNTEDFLSQVTARFDTPEKLQAAQRDGTIAAMLGAYNGQVDRSRSREFVDNRQPLLVQRARELGLFTDEQEKRGVQEALSRLEGKAARGDQAGVQEELASNPTLAKWFAGKLEGAALQGSRAEATFKDSLESSAAQRLHMVNADANDARRTAAAELSARASMVAAQNKGSGSGGTLPALVNSLREAAESRQKTEAENFKQNNMYGLDSLDPSRNIDKYIEAIDKNWSGGLLPDLGKPNQEFLKRWIAQNPGYTIADPDTKLPIQIPYPTSVVSKAVRQVDDWLSPEKQFANILQKEMSRAEVEKNFAAAREFQRNRANLGAVAFDALMNGSKK
jgi:hypothetical protein